MVQSRSVPDHPGSSLFHLRVHRVIQSLTRCDRQTHTHTNSRVTGGSGEGLGYARIIKEGVACGDGWEATGSELNECVACGVCGTVLTSNGLYCIGACCDLSPHFGRRAHEMSNN